MNLSNDTSQLGFPSEAACRFPSFVNVEVFRGACPCRCVHCPVGITPPSERSQRFGKKGIALALYGKIAREVALYPWSTLRLHSVGDPILWDGLAPALEICQREKVRSWIFTSATSASCAAIDTLCAHAAIVEVSVNSISRADYLRTKGVDCFDLVVANLHRLSRHRIPHGLMRLIVSRTQTLDAAADAAFVNYWRSSGIVDDAFVRSYHTYNGLLLELKEPKTTLPRQPCLVHWSRFNISVDGHAVVCFNELFRGKLMPEMILGDIRQEAIAEIWRGPKLSALRRSALAGNYLDLPSGDTFPCRNCTSCQVSDANRHTSEHQIMESVAR